jgi:hypothetical protein
MNKSDKIVIEWSVQELARQIQEASDRLLVADVSCRLTTRRSIFTPGTCPVCPKSGVATCLTMTV